MTNRGIGLSIPVDAQRGNLTRRGFLAVITALCFPACSRTGSANRGFPTNPIIYVCQASAGGSSDRFMRRLVSIIKKERILPVPISIEYHAGGGGAVAANYVKARTGNPYYLLNASGNFIAAPLRDPSVPGYAAFTPIARLAFDLNSIVVRSESPYYTIDDLIASSHNNAKQLSWAGTSVGSQDHLTVLILQRLAGSRFSFVSFGGSGEVTAALLGGHTDVALMEPLVAKPHAESGRVRILAVVAEHRLQSLATVPTLREQGYDVVLNMQRGVVSPPGIPEEARRYLIEAFKAIAATGAWNEYVASEGLLPAYMEGEAYREFLAQESAKWAGLLKEAHVIG